MVSSRVPPATWVPDRADVIWIQYNPAAGAEIPDLHPMLVASTREFNQRVGIVVGFPMTHSQQHRDNPFALPMAGPKGQAYVLAHQVKSFDWRARGAKPHRWGGGWGDLLGNALAILDDICGPRVA